MSTPTLTDQRLVLLPNTLDSKRTNYYISGANVVIETIAEYLSRVNAELRDSDDVIIFTPKTGYTSLGTYPLSQFSTIIANFDRKRYAFIGGFDDSNFTEITSIDTEWVTSIYLPSGASVAARIAGATEGVDYPAGWELNVGTSSVDLVITHNQSRRVADVTIWAVDGNQEQKLLNTASNNGLVTPDTNSLKIQSLATIAKPIKIYILWA